MKNKSENDKLLAFSSHPAKDGRAAYGRLEATINTRTHVLSGFASSL